jgi:phage tail sheath gpL-like
MALTDIGSQLTPGNPTEITFAPQTTPPSVVNGVVLIGHQSASAGSASGANYVPIQIQNVANVNAASGEANGYFGAGSELAKMVIAAVAANALNGTTFPPLFAIPLASSDTGWGQALVALDKMPGVAYVAGCYDANTTTNSNTLLAEATIMSTPQRVDAGQFGTIAVLANQSVTVASNLYKYNTPYGSFQWFRNTAPTQLNGEIAASVAAQLAANLPPFNPVKNSVLPNIIPSTVASDPIQVGGGLESEIALQAGWSPLRTLPNGTVAQLRARTLRIFLADNVTPVTAYFDVMDFNVLFYWRQTIVTRFSQVDFSNVKNSQGTEQHALAELIRLGQLFETNGMFQGMSLAAKDFKVQQNLTDRSRMDVLTPVDVIPILAVIATNIQATTAYDTITV